MTKLSKRGLLTSRRQRNNSQPRLKNENEFKYNFLMQVQSNHKWQLFIDLENHINQELRCL